VYGRSISSNDHSSWVDERMVQVFVENVLRAQACTARICMYACRTVTQMALSVCVCVSECVCVCVCLYKCFVCAFRSMFLECRFCYPPWQRMTVCVRDGT
jgi:hypothetical protein